MCKYVNVKSKLDDVLSFASFSAHMLLTESAIFFPFCAASSYTCIFIGIIFNFHAKESLYLLFSYTYMYLKKLKNLSRMHYIFM